MHLQISISMLSKLSMVVEKMWRVYPKICSTYVSSLIFYHFFSVVGSFNLCNTLFSSFLDHIPSAPSSVVNAQPGYHLLFL